MSEKPIEDSARDAAESLIGANCGFVMNINRLIGATSYHIDQQHELRRATKDEIQIIKDQISKHAPAPDLLRRFYSGFWEMQWPDPGGIVNYLNESDWRYYVIGGLAGNVSDLLDAFDLAPVEIEVGFTMLYLHEGQTHPGVACDTGRFFHVLENARRDDSFFVDISGEEIKAIRRIYTGLQQPDDRLIKVKRMAGQLGQLKNLPYYSPLRFLGYFAILESLLTHAPKPSDPYDSITRQVIKKLTLLDHRWTPKIDYTPFGDAKPEKVWSRLYSYRSRVAHGGEPDFDGELSVLKNKETALKIVKESTKAVIRQALLEPQLLLDLREC